MDTRDRGAKFAAYLGAQITGDAKTSGLTVKALAARMGIDRSQLDRYLKGTRPMPASIVGWAAEAIGENPRDIVARAYERFIRDHGVPEAPDATTDDLAVKRAERRTALDRKAAPRAARGGPKKSETLTPVDHP